MSTCACIKKTEFDISVSHRGCKYLVLEDHSTWVGDTPPSYDVFFKLLSRGMQKSITLNTQKRNTFTSEQITGAKNQCLPDDIYCFTVETCGYTLNINRAYLCTLETKVNDLVYKYANSMSESERSTLFGFKNQLDSIKINAEMGNLKTAQKLFKSLKEDLKAYNCDNC